LGNRGIFIAAIEHVRSMERRRSMEGLSYIVDEKGRRRAVVVDLDRHGELWEDIYDAMIAEARIGEDRLSWHAVRTGKASAKPKKR